MKTVKTFFALRRFPAAMAAGLLLALVMTPVGCDGRRQLQFTGRTMGTTYSVKVVTGYFNRLSGLQQQIDRRLAAINHSMSTYQEDSEISRFNRWERTGKPFAVSGDFMRVMTVADTIFDLSNGAWDATVDPLVNLWGFGRRKQAAPMPDDKVVRDALAHVGFRRIRILAPTALVKTDAAVSLDLGSIAKGYGVDQLAELLRGEGLRDFLVEIGGEVYAAGRRRDGTPWRVGINVPKAEAPTDQVYRVAALSDRALATSGEYRNFFEMNGRRYSHVIDPRTGFPVANGVVSVSIEADSCTLADGLATAVMVMGAADGLALIERLDGVEGLIVEMTADGALVDHGSSGHNFVDIE
jgi:thiamine biosynthesis lipoprotein